ncbi:GTPase HflX [Candidatus Persebacteraceae bacterium Df01]|jgi:GTP-binding protein HflX|uniref:GTPase HflX n=1 Tax=Candidatus Doriopsillibacter californiensis TaxID=2970740 RepID=A0ABT7QJE9_9GAMM|nr:GTPase HflX [Candidatus Persebacteraceae bacterium Df01]
MHNIDRRRALLVAVLQYPGDDAREESEELTELAAAAGYFGIAVHVVRLRQVRAATLLGEGAIKHCLQLAEKFTAELIIVGAELSSMQARNLKIKWERSVIDRSDLILNIFGDRAQTHNSKLQVELARCRRDMSRLAGRWTHLERQRGGIGLRGGPGEKQIEIDRRLLAHKAKRIERQIKKMSASNSLARTRRERFGVPTAALVGYTNVGKSTLFNLLTSANAPTNNRLFDTLESTARRLYVDGEQLVVTDTVGFIRRLPHELLTGFHATLQEAATSNVIIIVADAAHSDCEAQLAVVRNTLDSIGAPHDNRLTVMNKIDKAELQSRTERAPCGKIEKVWLSSHLGTGVSALREALGQASKYCRAERQSSSQH